MYVYYIPDSTTLRARENIAEYSAEDRAAPGIKKLNEIIDSTWPVKYIARVFRQL